MSRLNDLAFSAGRIWANVAGTPLLAGIDLSGEMGDGVVTVFVCGDVMPGRGVDEILPHPGDPELREAYARDARAYVDLAERAHGPIPRPLSLCWPGGDALGILARRAAHGADAGQEDAAASGPGRGPPWLRAVLDRISRGFGSRVDLRPDGMLTLR